MDYLPSLLAYPAIVAGANRLPRQKLMVQVLPVTIEILRMHHNSIPNRNAERKSLVPAPNIHKAGVG